MSRDRWFGSKREWDSYNAYLGRKSDERFYRWNMRDPEFRRHRLFYQRLNNETYRDQLDREKRQAQLRADRLREHPYEYDEHSKRMRPMHNFYSKYETVTGWEIWEEYKDGRTRRVWRLKDRPPFNFPRSKDWRKYEDKPYLVHPITKRTPDEFEVNAWVPGTRKPAGFPKIRWYGTVPHLTQVGRKNEKVWPDRIDLIKLMHPPLRTITSKDDTIYNPYKRIPGTLTLKRKRGWE